MDITISGIKDQLAMGYHYVAEKAGELAGHSVKVMKQGIGYVQQDARIAAAVIAVANLLFLEIAVLVAILTNKLLSKVVGEDAELKMSTISAKNLVILATSAAALVGMNVALAKSLSINLKPLTIIAISTGSCAFNVIFRILRASNQEAAEPKAG